MEKSAEEKVSQIEWEAKASAYGKIQDFQSVWMYGGTRVDDTQTTIATYGVATCVALAITAKDDKGKVHRIITHNSYTGEQITRRIEAEIKECLQQLEPLKELHAIICSMDTFCNPDMLDEREKDIISEINNIFQFYKDKHPYFTVPFHRSWYVKINPQGDFEYADESMIAVYEKIIEEERIKYLESEENSLK